MRNATLEKWIWVLIYAGLLTASLGVFVHDHAPAFGWVLMLSGGVSVAIGAVLIFVRARRSAR